MLNTYFTNLQSVTMNTLNSANCSIKAAVAWINFPFYEPVFMTLLNRGIKVKIIVNDDGNNRKHEASIDRLIQCGAKIKLLRVAGIMHHKFCIVDNNICMFGSFNWTYNANTRNIEDLNITDNLLAVDSYLSEFKALWELSKNDLAKLRKPDLCQYCKKPILNIMFMEQEGDYQTKIDVLQQCSCSQHTIYTDYFDVSVYNNYLGTIEQFDDAIADAQQSGDEIYYNQLVSQQDFALSCYLSTVRNNRMGCPIIHAVGVKSWEWIDKHDGYWCYKIIWKERGTESYIENEYEITE